MSESSFSPHYSASKLGYSHIGETKFSFRVDRFDGEMRESERGGCHTVLQIPYLIYHQDNVDRDCAVLVCRFRCDGVH